MKLNTKWQNDITIEDLKNLEDGCGLGITESDCVSDNKSGIS